MLALATFEEVDNRFMIGWTTYTLGLTDALSGRLDEADERFRAALRVFQETADVSGYTLVLDSMAALVLRQGDAQRAATIAGFVDNLERTTGNGLNRTNRTHFGYDPERVPDQRRHRGGVRSGRRDGHSGRPGVRARDEGQLTPGPDRVRLRHSSRVPGVDRRMDTASPTWSPVRHMRRSRLLERTDASPEVPSAQVCQVPVHRRDRGVGRDRRRDAREPHQRGRQDPLGR